MMSCYISCVRVLRGLLYCAFLSTTTTANDANSLKFLTDAPSPSKFNPLTPARAPESAKLSNEPKEQDSEAAFIRDALAQRAVKQGLANDAQVQAKLDDLRKDFLARIQLEHQIEQGLPDFTARAQELYQAKRQSDYTLPLRLRVRLIQLRLADETQRDSVIQKMQAIRTELQQGKLSFIEAVERYSDAPEKRLTQGDSQWFYQGQLASALYEAALKLTPSQPLSEPIITGRVIYLAYYLDRKEAETIPFDTARAELERELVTTYKNERRQGIIDELRQQFKQAARLHDKP